MYNYWLNDQKEVKFSHHDWVKPQPAPQPSDTSAMFALPTAPAPPGAHVSHAGEQTGGPEGEEEAVTALLARIDFLEGDAGAEAVSGTEQAGQASAAPDTQASAAPDTVEEAEAASHSADDATVAPAAAEETADADEAATVNVDADAPAHLSFDEDEDEARPAPSSGGPFGGTEELREIVPEQGGEQET